MSQENVELVRAVYALGSKGLETDPADWDRAFREYLDEQYELHMGRGYPEGEQVLRGDRVVVFVRVVARGGASEVPIGLETAHVVHVRRGRITSTWFYRDRSDALEAVGLRE
jgi:ketosteroid isomerase-like protein